MTLRDDLLIPHVAPGAGYAFELQHDLELIADAAELGGGGAPGGAVNSVAGRGGNVVLTSVDITNFNAAVSALLSAVVAGAPGTLDTLDELAAALGDDPNFATTLTGLIGAKYTKPGAGIPKADLVAAVQTSLGKADTATQPADLAVVANRLGGLTFQKAATPSADPNTITFVMLP